MTQKVFFPNLDGLRTIAFLAVFFIHSFYTENPSILNNAIYQLVNTPFVKGEYGVNLFFVLSGFLITYLLCSEERLNKKLNVGKFYMRRFLRIWPLYFACVFYGFFAEPIIMDILGKPINETADPLLFITFLSNFSNIINGPTEVQNLAVLWSVAVEEQFYLFWPLLMVIFKKNRITICVITILLSIVFRYFHFDNLIIISFHTLSVISDMAIGAIIGILSFNLDSFVKFFENLKKWHILLVYIIGVSLIVFEHQLFYTAFGVAVKRFIISCFFAFAILEQNYAHRSIFKMSNSNLFSTLGKYTYGLYCLHMIAITATKHLLIVLEMHNTLLDVLLWQTLISLMLTIVMAYFSYHYFEKPFLAHKNKFAYISKE